MQNKIINTQLERSISVKRKDYLALRNALNDYIYTLEKYSYKFPKHPIDYLFGQMVSSILPDNVTYDELWSLDEVCNNLHLGSLYSFLTFINISEIMIRHGITPLHLTSKAFTTEIKEGKNYSKLAAIKELLDLHLPKIQRDQNSPVTMSDVDNVFSHTLYVSHLDSNTIPALFRNLSSLFDNIVKP